MKATIAIPSLLVVSASAAAITSDVISSRKILSRSKLSKQSTTVGTFRKLDGKAEKQGDAKSAKEDDRKKKKKRDRKKVKGKGKVVERFNNGGDGNTNSLLLPNTMAPSTSKPSGMPTSKPSLPPTATPSTTPTSKPTPIPSIAAVEPSPSPPLPEPTLVPTYNPTVSNNPTTPLSACPAAYDTSKTDYVGGDKIETVQDAPGYIFECDADKVIYCNIAEWDDSLLEQDVDAKEKWISAWVNVGMCITADGTEVAPSMAPSVTTITDTYTLPNDDTDTIPTTATSPTMAAAPTPDTLPACPPVYDMTKTTYVEGELVTLNDYIFECITLHVTYCNIAEWDDSLLTTDSNAFEMWDNAWMMVGPCTITGTTLPESPPALEEYDSGGPPAPSIAPVTVSPLATPSKAPVTTTLSPTVASTVKVSTQLSEVTTTLPTMAATPEVAVDTIPACPPAYDMTKTTYVEGVIVTLNDHIFQCMTLHVTYCNIAEWDDSLLTTDSNAFEMWDNAWVLVGPCTVVTGANFVEVDIEDINYDNIDDNDDNTDNDDNIVDVEEDIDDSYDDIDDLAEPPAPVLLATTKSPIMMVSTQISEVAHPTLSPTMRPFGNEDAFTPSPTILPPCPADYDITKTTYIGGDLVKLSGNAFECQVDFVKYCNIGLWDDSLLVKDENAEEAWNNAWVFFSECSVKVSGDSNS